MALTRLMELHRPAGDGASATTAPVARAAKVSSTFRNDHGEPLVTDSIAVLWLLTIL